MKINKGLLPTIKQLNKKNGWTTIKERQNLP